MTAHLLGLLGHAASTAVALGLAAGAIWCTERLARWWRP
jgi:hypothetical protein